MKKHFRSKKDVPKLAAELGRTESATYVRCSKLGLTSRTKKPRWTAEELDFLKKHVHLMTYKEIARKLNRTEHSVIHAAKRLGLKKK
ncbi:hypothetical protein GCM10011571_33510 [Marinithermofilum abyssi]|uniref:Homeodomain-like domain-containing protein n=1 Tax=Marinithermofilum abyssi TaxID=1571185 RepID=A0A8J2VEG5_9BACL|nr:hypothetical protein [Marinithermofilum abyssi]GGE28694.1 hypothetical protein GCM10011571_33510 [Marinithermofilum abyssi]